MKKGNTGWKIIRIIIIGVIGFTLLGWLEEALIAFTTSQDINKIDKNNVSPID